MCCRARRTLDVAERLRAVGMIEESDAVLESIAAPKKPKYVERYYRECRDSDGAKAMGEDEAASYCSAVAWSIYCKYKNPKSPHCRQKQYIKR